MEHQQRDTVIRAASPLDYRGAKRGLSWISMHPEVADDVLVPGTYEMSDDAIAAQAAVIAAEEERQRAEAACLTNANQRSNLSI